MRDDNLMRAESRKYGTFDRLNSRSRIIPKSKFCQIIVIIWLDSIDSFRWPAGLYGIPKPASGCPLADGFQWQEGWRSQDTDGTYSSNAKSPEFHLDGIVDRKKVKRSFCIKTSTTGDYNRTNWPPG